MLQEKKEITIIKRFLQRCHNDLSQHKSVPDSLKRDKLKVYFILFAALCNKNDFIIACSDIFYVLLLFY